MRRVADEGKELWGNALEISPEVRPEQLDNYRRALMADAHYTLSQLATKPRYGERVVLEMSWHFERDVS